MFYIQPFYVHDVNFTTGDDNIAGHANHSLVEDSYFGTGHGASIGSLGSGRYLHNITFRNITFHGTTAGCRIKSHAGASGRVWDVHYQNLTMYDVQTAIDLTQFYGTKSKQKSTFVFDQIYYDNIKSYRSDPSGSRRRKKLSGTAKSDVIFDCDTGSNGKNNCDVVMNDVEFVNSAATMQCVGVRGTSDGVSGITNCLKKAA